MKTRNTISSKRTLYIVMTVLVMILAGSIYCQADDNTTTYIEKRLYYSDFQDWDKLSASSKVQQVRKRTIDAQELVFNLYRTAVDPTGTNDKFNDYTNYKTTVGYLQTGKTENGSDIPYIEIEPLKSVTTIKFVQAATGGKRGLGLEVQGEGDANWVKLHIDYISKANGEEVTVNVNRKNVRLRFYSLAYNQNAYMTSLEIYGNVEVKQQISLTYYDTDHKTILGTETVEGGSTFTPNKEIQDNVTIPADNTFRGWFNSDEAAAEKVVEGSILITDQLLYAKATPIETATDNKEYNYDLKKNNWYQEDHELIEIDGGAWKSTQHGWGFSNGGTIKLQVAKKAQVDLTLCSQSKGGTITVTDSRGTAWDSFNANANKEGSVQSIEYKGGTPTTLTIDIPAGTYIHSVHLRNYIPIYITFDCSDKNIQGTGPEKIQCDTNTGMATMPDHSLLYREGWSFAGWTDGTNIYEAGKEYLFENNVTLKPKMEENTIDLTDTNTPITVEWNFDYRNAPKISLNDKSTYQTLPYTKTVNIEGTNQDVTLMMDVSNGGKIDNTNSRVNNLTGEGAQINDNTSFTVPAVYGMNISIHASEKVDGENNNNETHFGTGTDDATIEVSDENGSVPAECIQTTTDNNKTISFTYKGDALKAKIKIVKSGSKESWGFYKAITVTYPVLPNIEIANVISNIDNTNYPNETTGNAGKVSTELKNPEATSHTNTGKRYKEGDIVTISANPEYGYVLDKLTANGVDHTSQSIDHTITAGKNTIVATFKRMPLHKVTVRTANARFGSFSMSSGNDNFYNETSNKDGIITKAENWYTEGTKVSIYADAATNYILDNWSDGIKTLSETDPYTFNMGTEDMNIIANYKLGNIGTVIFKIPEGSVNGASDECKGAYSITPAEQKNVRSFTIPSNYTFYKSMDAAGKGSTLAYWVEEGNNSENKDKYEPGHLYSFKNTNEVLTLVPVFTENPTTIENRRSNTLVRYDFGRSILSYDDPKTKHRKVCAQPVDIGHKEKPFWTTQAYVETVDEGVDKPHMRDIAIWCDTGDNGFIRNTDLDKWCAFGPGTTLWVPAGNGTKITMLTYSKITTTTFDDTVPTLDEERTAAERQKADTKKLYVYSYTTRSAADRVAIKIGDDYSYYQWLELDVPKANLANLHATVDDDKHGAITAIESATGKYEVTELEDGGHAFQKGDRVRMTIKRKFGYELDKIVDLAKEDEDGNPLAIIKMNDDGTWDSATGDDNNGLTLNKIEPTERGERTTYIIEFNITDHRDFKIYFKEKHTYYIHFNTGKLASGIAPEAIWVEKDDKFTIPSNKTLYYEGNTLDHWEDENKEIFNIGSTYTAIGKDRRLYPVFKANTFNILDLKTEAIATWNLNKNDGAPTINYEKNKGILVTQLKNSDGKRIDLKVELDATNGGKFNNTDGNKTNRIQINAQSIINFPSTPQCVVKWVATNDFNQIKIAGKIVETTAENKKEAEGQCSGDSAYEQIEFIEGIYSKCFSVTYKPQTTARATIATLSCGNGVNYEAANIKEQMEKDGHVTFKVSPWLYDETIPAVTGTATEDGTVEISSATVLTPECIAKVKTKAGIIVETYPIVFVWDGAPENNPELTKLTVNGTEYTGTENEIHNVPRSGVIKLSFSRTMDAANINYDGITYTAQKGKEQVFKYWNMPAGGTITLSFNHENKVFKDIYGKECQQDLKLVMHIMDDDTYYHHHKFDFIVGKDGNIDKAIEAANSNTKTDGHRYYIFVPDGKYKLTGDSNGQTKITKSNISIIGQSKEGTTIFNRPIEKGISTTATIYIEKNQTDFYAEDLTLENTFDYFGSSANGEGQAVSFLDRGNRSIMKNVALKSYQDTYYSNNANEDFRGYFETCDFYGVVDFICGNGNIWFEKCNLIHRDRDGNNIVAPSTEAVANGYSGQEWGYVFNECSIKPESDNMLRFEDKNWTLARAWGGSPACTFLNTRMFTQPKSYGWGKMTTNLLLRFHEYNSKDAAGNALSLATRSLASCSPAIGSDDCVLTDEQAKEYTLRNVVGGYDAFEPDKLCKQIDAASRTKGDMDDNNELWEDNIEIDNNELKWDAHTSALCYVIFKLNKDTGKWEYLENTTESSINLLPYGSGYYCVRAANQRGGLGSATALVNYESLSPYELNIKQTGDLTVDGQPYGWSTICLPFNAKVPNGVTAYAATAHNEQSTDKKVIDLKMTLTPVEVIDALEGYVVYGPAGTHQFSPTSRQCDKETILDGNSTDYAISSVNINCYVLANKTWGLGFYKYTGSTLAANRAWLPQDMVSLSDQEVLETGTRAITLVIEGGTAVMPHPVFMNDNTGEAVYTLSGKRVDGAIPQGVYISRKKGKFLKK